MKPSKRSKQPQVGRGDDYKSVVLSGFIVWLRSTEQGTEEFDLLTAVLHRAADVQECEAKLKRNERVGVVVPAPYNPQHVAQQEQPKPPVALKLFLRANHPRGNDGNGHRRPLDSVKNIHLQRFLSLYKWMLISLS